MGALDAAYKLTISGLAVTTVFAGGCVRRFQLYIAHVTSERESSPP